MPNTTTSSPRTKRCHRCGSYNRHGVIFCEECGSQIDTGLISLSEKIDQATSTAQKQRYLDLKEAENTLTTIYVRKSRENFRPGTSVFAESMVVRLEVNNSDQPLIFRPFNGKAIILGRMDLEGTFQPDVDLMPYDARTKGISRRHAAFTLSGKRLEIRDLNSKNGTFLNDVLLEPKEPHQVRDGDTIRLGGLPLTIYFQG